MARVIAERMTVRKDEGFVVFLIGMRVNRWWKVHKWLPVAMAMPRMLKELQQKPEAGMLGHEMSMGVIVQYWESMEKLLAYAKDRGGEHFPAWAAFNRSVASNGDVGIWHETYLVPPGHFECVYNNMPRYGLGKFAELVPATGNLQEAKQRVKALAAQDSQ